MTIDEAIKRFSQEAEVCEGNADNYTRNKNPVFAAVCAKEAAEHRQLAEWLTELVAYRKLRICGNCRHYVGGTTHFGECHVTSDIEPCVVSVDQTACDTFFDYKDFRNGV